MSAILPQVKKKRTDLLGKNNKDVCLMEKILNVFNMVLKKMRFPDFLKLCFNHV